MKIQENTTLLNTQLNSNGANALEQMKSYGRALKPFVPGTLGIATTLFLATMVLNPTTSLSPCIPNLDLYKNEEIVGKLKLGIYNTAVCFGTASFFLAEGFFGSITSVIAGFSVTILATSALGDPAIVLSEKPLDAK